MKKDNFFLSDGAKQKPTKNYDTKPSSSSHASSTQFRRDDKQNENRHKQARGRPSSEGKPERKENKTRGERPSHLKRFHLGEKKNKKIQQKNKQYYVDQKARQKYLRMRKHLLPDDAVSSSPYVVCKNNVSHSCDSHHQTSSSDTTTAVTGAVQTIGGDQAESPQDNIRTDAKRKQGNRRNSCRGADRKEQLSRSGGLSISIETHQQQPSRRGMEKNEAKSGGECKEEKENYITIDGGEEKGNKQREKRRYRKTSRGQIVMKDLINHLVKQINPR
eukprot:GHVQ01013228.1.p1 GENE.GHVQ01013228.1~~GHVQ01013228.1.p1  ORF type:complete len:275 (+),score=57.86 GHVQ01013228.1:532-1356(+)